MRKHIFGKQLGRDIHERKALLKGLSSSLVIAERIETTEEKAKAVKPLVERLVTKAKRKDTKHAYSLLQPYLNAQALTKMIKEIAPRFKKRDGGYTRIIKLQNRLSDNARMVYLEWVEKPQKLQAVVPQQSSSDQQLEKTKELSENTTPRKAAKKTEGNEKKQSLRKPTSKETEAK